MKNCKCASIVCCWHQLLNGTHTASCFQILHIESRNNWSVRFIHKYVTSDRYLTMRAIRSFCWTHKQQLWIEYWSAASWSAMFGPMKYYRMSHFAENMCRMNGIVLQSRQLLSWASGGVLDWPKTLRSWTSTGVLLYWPNPQTPSASQCNKAEGWLSSHWTNDTKLIVSLKGHFCVFSFLVHAILFIPGAIQWQRICSDVWNKRLICSRLSCENKVISRQGTQKKSSNILCWRSTRLARVATTLEEVAGTENNTSPWSISSPGWMIWRYYCKVWTYRTHIPD